MDRSTVASSRLGRAVPGADTAWGDVLILDTLGSRKGAAVRWAIRDVVAKLLFLPPTDLNPIEQVVVKLKTLPRKAEEGSIAAVGLGSASYLTGSVLTSAAVLQARRMFRVSRSDGVIGSQPGGPVWIGRKHRRGAAVEYFWRVGRVVGRDGPCIMDDAGGIVREARAAR
jgi:hypothetical protein